MDLADQKNENQVSVSEIEAWRSAILLFAGDKTEENANLKKELHAMKNTISWRVTAPLRSTRTMLSKLRSRFLRTSI